MDNKKLLENVAMEIENAIVIVAKQEQTAREQGAKLVAVQKNQVFQRLIKALNEVKLALLHERGKLDPYSRKEIE